jgi:hypothetical protein
MTGVSLCAELGDLYESASPSASDRPQRIGAPRRLSQEGSHILSLALVGASAHTLADLSSSGAEVK